MSLQSPATPIGAGFARPVWDSQAVFRHVLEAMAHPGRVTHLPVAPEAPAGFHPATAAACLTLLDYETRVWLQAGPGDAEARTYLRFHCGCPFAASEAEGDFALILAPGAAPPLDAFSPGLAEQPHRSATAVLQVQDLHRGPLVRLRGPGIAEVHDLRVAGLPRDFWAQWGANGALFPLGVDVILTCRDEVAALPRTVQAET